MLSDLNRVDFHNVQEQVIKPNNSEANIDDWSRFINKFLGCLGLSLRSWFRQLAGKWLQSHTAESSHTRAVGQLAGECCRPSHETLWKWTNPWICSNSSTVPFEVVVLQASWFRFFFSSPLRSCYDCPITHVIYVGSVDWLINWIRCWFVTVQWSFVTWLWGVQHHSARSIWYACCTTSTCFT